MTAVMYSASVRRWHIQVQGIVQGVGFRPFVHRVAVQLGLVGFVFNDGDGVTIEVEGEEEQLGLFSELLVAAAPPLARIDTVISNNIPLRNDTVFRIMVSRSEARRAQRTLVSPDVATCDECLRELLNPEDRRYRYPFINCTNCGPRFTIIRSTPYDRELTTMSSFDMCEQCAEEYHDPANRRFHAQPNACPICGPQVYADPISKLAKDLAGGAVVALKGIGGFHLACDALNPDAVAGLRSRKHRDAKPFAVMVADVETARRLCAVSEAEAKLLQSPRRPIVLMQWRADCPIAPEVAPSYNTLGLMLPYSPLHTLLLQDFAEQIGIHQIAALVMTSGNRSDEPIAYQNEDAEERLGPIADSMLVHDRDIHVRADDSVTRIVAGGEQVLRRSRGYVPEPIKLSQAFPVPILAVGGHLKNTFCLGKDHHAFVSHHIGDLDNLETLIDFRAGIEHFQRLFDIEPGAVAYDLHPDYMATQHAASLDYPYRIGVQHHHAHIASVLAEHGIDEAVIGIAADGTGYGTDATVWGGEIMIANLSGFERAAHLMTFPLPGGEKAIQYPWRVTAVLLQQAFGDDFLDLDIPFTWTVIDEAWQVFARMIDRKLNSPLTSSMGRLFDAVSVLLTLRQEVDYEGQAAIELEMLAEPTAEAYPYEIGDERPIIMDMLPTIRAIVADIQNKRPSSLIAGRFHRTLAEVMVDVCEQVRAFSGLQSVALSGGVFQNRLLLEQTLALLESAGFKTYINRRVPPNDGGLSLGQAAVAARKISQG